MSEERLVILSLSTEKDQGAENFENSALHFGYDVRMVARNETFYGWSWRTKKYIQTIESIRTSDMDIFVLCDSSDLFVARPPADLLAAFFRAGHDVIVGAEPACCNGYYQNETVKHIAVDGTAKAVPGSRYRFPNGGFVMGRAKPLLRLLEANKDEPDDQGGYLQKMLDEYGNYFALDDKQMLVGNVPNMHGGYWVQGDDRSIREIDRWQLKGNEVKNLATGEFPAFFHFPGKNWQSYNSIATEIFGAGITNTPQSLQNMGPVVFELRPKTINNITTSSSSDASSIAHELIAFATPHTVQQPSQIATLVCNNTQSKLSTTQAILLVASAISSGLFVYFALSMVLVTKRRRLYY